MVTPEEIKTWIEEKLESAVVEVEVMVSILCHCQLS